MSVLSDFLLRKCCCTNAYSQGCSHKYLELTTSRHGWQHHRLDGHKREEVPGVGDGQGSLASCRIWCCKESDTTEWLNWTELNWIYWTYRFSPKQDKVSLRILLLPPTQGRHGISKDTPEEDMQTQKQSYCSLKVTEKNSSIIQGT